MGAEGTTTMAKKASAPKKTKAPLDHPPYVEMIKAALLALKERTGSSHYAIAKHIEEQQKVTLPPNFRKLLSVQLRKLVVSGRLVKVKNSFKLPPTAVRKPPAATESKPKPKQPKTAGVKAKASKATSVKAKAKAVVKPKAKAADKVKKVKATAKPVKAAKSATVKSPARKVAAVKVKKAVEKAKKPKSIKSPAKKAPAAKKAKK